MEGTAAVTITTILTDVGTVFTKVIAWAGAVGEIIVGDPALMLFCIGIPLCGIGVGMFARLLRSRG